MTTIAVMVVSMVAQGLLAWRVSSSSFDAPTPQPQIATQAGANSRSSQRKSCSVGKACKVLEFLAAVAEWVIVKHVPAHQHQIKET